MLCFPGTKGPDVSWVNTWLYCESRKVFNPFSGKHSKQVAYGYHMRKTSCFLVPSDNSFRANHPVFPESSPSFAIMLISSCVYYFLWSRPGRGRQSCSRRGHSLTGICALFWILLLPEILVGEGAHEKYWRLDAERKIELPHKPAGNHRA